MAAHAFPVLYALLVWWFSTGLILYLNGLPARTFRWTMAAATGLLVAAIVGLAWTRDDTSLAGAYLAFTWGILAWGWHETSFLLGAVTGPRKRASEQGARGWRRFSHAVETILWHELAIAATAVLIVAVTWGGANQVGTWTFLLLWVMRLSAKLNLFLGVPNLARELLPEHLRYLGSYFRKRTMNLLFPISISASTIVGVLLVVEIATLEPGSFAAAGLVFVTALLVLAIVEHWFLVVPLPVNALWSWALGARAKDVTVIGEHTDDSGLPPLRVHPHPAFSIPGRRP